VIGYGSFYSVWCRFPPHKRRGEQDWIIVAQWAHFSPNLWVLCWTASAVNLARNGNRVIACEAAQPISCELVREGRTCPWCRGSVAISSELMVCASQQSHRRGRSSHAPCRAPLWAPGGCHAGAARARRALAMDSAGFHFALPATEAFRVSRTDCRQGRAPLPPHFSQVIEKDRPTPMCRPWPWPNVPCAAHSRIRCGRALSIAWHCVVLWSCMHIACPCSRAQKPFWLVRLTPCTLPRLCSSPLWTWVVSDTI